jgi:cytochrome c oxidase subunit II
VRFRREAGILAAGVLLLAGCGSKQNALSPESPDAHGIATLWWIMLAASGVGLAVVVAILLGAYLRRHRAGDDRRALAVVLGLGIAAPIAILAALFLYSDIFLVQETAPPPALAATNAELKIRVIAHQYWWEIRYADGRVVTANEIHIPVRTHVEVLVHTDDVIHSFWVPQLNRKIDMEPEQVNRVDLYAEEEGRYRGQCAEFCGLQHAHMGFYVFAEPTLRFERWLADQARPAARTSPLFDEKCASCHTVRGTDAQGDTGPDLTHVASRQSLGALTLPNTPDRMRGWIRDPQRWKPGNLMPTLDLTDAQVSQLAAYMESLR